MRPAQALLSSLVAHSRKGENQESCTCRSEPAVGAAENSAILDAKVLGWTKVAI